MGTSGSAPRHVRARGRPTADEAGPYALPMMPSIGSGEFQAEREALLERAGALSARLARVALGATSLGRERAILRLIGVTGVDREGRPLAAEVVDRYVDGQAERLAMGIGFPFAMALLEYDTTPQQLALDVAAGSVDLQLESELLAEPVQYAAAADLLSRLAIAAVERIDANRVARGELLDVLHDRPMPWIGATIRETSIDGAEREAGELVRAGFDLGRVEVPATRELAIRLGALGEDVLWRPRGIAGDPESTPVGSQRGLAQLRQVLDRAAAERGAYVRLAIAPTALAGPEGAIVAAFERADVLELGPMREMFVTGVDPDRAFVDFAFAVRVAMRAGVMVHIDAGPLMVAPDLDAGVNADPPTRSGRSIALQLLAVLTARACGIPAAHLIVGALPVWFAGEPDAAARALAEVVLRRELFEGHLLAFVEPSEDETTGWASAVAAIQPGSGVARIQLQQGADPNRAGGLARSARQASEVAAQLEGQLSGGRLAGIAHDHAAGALTAAMAALDLLEREGWPALTGATTARAGWGRVGADAVTATGNPADPVERALAG